MLRFVACAYRRGHSWISLRHHHSKYIYLNGGQSWQAFLTLDEAQNTPDLHVTHPVKFQKRVKSTLCKALGSEIVRQTLC